MAYDAWRFAFRYQEELVRKVGSRQAPYQQLFLQDQGHVGIVLGIGGALLCCLFAVLWGWRAWTAYPAAIIMPDRLWLHPSFGKQPIPFTNIVGVRLDRVGNSRSRTVALIVDLGEPAKRNGVFWAFPRAADKWSVGEAAVDCSLFGLARFRDRLVQEVQARENQKRT